MKFVQVLIVAIGMALTFGVVGCKKEEPSAAEKMGNAMEEAAEGVGEAAEEAGEELEKAAEDVKEAVSE